jgi:hypothetical protein
VLVLGGLLLVLLGGGVVLQVLTGHFVESLYGAEFAAILVSLVVGVLVAWHQPANAVGWLMITFATVFVVKIDSGLYSILDYRHHGGSLPLGLAALFLASTTWQLVFLTLPLPILVFPNGRLPSGRWRWVFWAYLAGTTSYMTSVVVAEAGTDLGHPIQVDPVGGQSAGAAHLTGIAAVVLVCWPLIIGRQVVAWRRASGERRQQLKWLMSGAAVTILSGVATFAIGSSGLPNAVQVVAVPVAVLGFSALPVSIGVAVLKYRLYEIDRLLSRTISYLVVTGVLAGVFLGVVFVATRVLPFSSPVAVAASTLAAAALFNPLRRRVQRLVDRRFNRSRYNLEAIVADFRTRLRTAADIDTIRNSLQATVDGSLQPAHTTVWLRPNRDA